MSVAGYSTLVVVPEVQNLAASIQRQTGNDLAIAGRRAGQQYGTAAGREASKQLTGSLRSGLRTVAAPLAGIAAGLGGLRLFGDIIDEAQEATKVTKVTEALIKATGGTANLAAGEVGDLAEQMSKYAAVDDELVQAGENVLLTFRKIRNEVGEGNDVFTRATKAGLDLSTVFGGDLVSANKTLGKALNDPVKGLTALGRAGVQFTDDQKSQIKSLVQNNNLLDAQKIILNEIESQVGGTAGASKTALDELGVSFKNLEESIGLAAAPALNAFANFAADEAIPALQDTGSATVSLAKEIDSLPAPIKAAAAAFVALKAAQALGLTAGAGSVVAATRRGLGDTAAAIALTRGEFQRLQVEQQVTAASTGQMITPLSRVQAGLAAVRADAIGAGAGLRTGLRGALNLVGGPWGVAFIAGTAVLANFWAEHQKAKQRVEDFTATLDKQTGAITENSREFAVKQLLDDGVLEASKRLGVSLTTVTDAALGQKDAIAALNAEIGSRGALDDQAAEDAIKLKSAIDQSNGVVHDAIANHRLFSEALGHTDASTDATATSTGRATQETGQYAAAARAASSEVRRLLNAENARRAGNLTDRQDRLALLESLAAARDEARDGARTLNENTEAGRANLRALYDLAGQWQNSSAAVKNAKGSYIDFRVEFIKTAMSMGDTRAEARKLANEILGLPTNRPIEITTPGMAEAIRNARTLKEQLQAARTAGAIRLDEGRTKFPDIRRASGGPIYGPGTGTSDSILMWGSNGEYMQSEKAHSYYGTDFMDALNNLRLPKFAGGGNVGGQRVQTTVPVRGGAHFTIEKVYVQDMNDFLRQADDMARHAEASGV